MKPILRTIALAFCVAGATAPVQAQLNYEPYAFGTVAGHPVLAGSTDATGGAARFRNPSGTAVDAAGNVYVADTENHTIRKITPAGVVSTLAGLAGTLGTVNGLGNAARFNAPRGVAVDSAGTIYVSERSGAVIRKITPAGMVTTLAGSGSFGSADGTGVAAQFNQPFGLAVDSAGNVYVADTQNQTIRKITPDGVVSTLAGLAGNQGNADGTGSAARFSNPLGVAVDGAGNVYVADEGNNHAIRKITPAGDVRTLAGGGDSGFGTTDGTVNPTVAKGSFLFSINTLALTNDTATLTTLIAHGFSPGDSITVSGLTGPRAVLNGSHTVLASPTATGFTFTLTPSKSFAVTQKSLTVGVALLNASGHTFAVGDLVTVNLGDPAFDGDISVTSVNTPNPGNFTYARSGANVTAASASGGASVKINTVTDRGSAQFFSPNSLAVDSAGNVYVADNIFLYSGRVRKITTGGDVITLAGGTIGGSADGTGSAAQFVTPYGVSVDSTGNLCVADNYNCTIRKVTSGGTVTTLAGSPGQGYADGTGAGALFNLPSAVAVDVAGNLYVSDTGNQVIRKITPAGIVTTLAGLPGNQGNADGTGSAARFSNPAGIAVDPAGTVYVVDSSNGSIRKITPGGVVSTLARGFSYPSGIGLDSQTNLYVADTYSQTIRKVTPTGVVTVFAGSGSAGSADGTGTAAQFNYPNGLAVDGAGNVYVAEENSRIVRKITPAGVVTTLAGTAGMGGVTDATGSAARFANPRSVAVDGAGNVYVTDVNVQLIRKITPAGVVTTLGGVGVVFDSGYADGIGRAARFSYPQGIAVDSVGKVYVADTQNHTIRTDFPVLIIAPIPEGNNAGMYFAGWVGRQYRLEYTGDLKNPSWTMLTTVTLATGSTQITDAQSAGVAKRFYRVVPLP